MAGWQENKVIGIVAGVIFVLSMALMAVFIFMPKKIEMTLMSESGGDVIKMKVLPGAAFPIVNPKTGTKDLYPAVKLKCSDGYIFYNIIKTTGTEAPPAMYTCPKDPSLAASLAPD